jgi:hypothetical protein
MAEPHIRRLSLFDYASLSVSKVLYFGEAETDHVSMPALVQAADLPKLLVFAIRDLKTQEEIALYISDKATSTTIDTMKKRVYSLITSGVLPAYDPHVFLRIDPNEILPIKDDYLVRLDDVSDWLRMQGIEIGYAINDKENNYELLDKPLTTRERETLLTIIAALCKEAKLDYTKHSKTAGLIQSTAATMGLSIGETTIEGHLKKIPDALATRMK